MKQRVWINFKELRQRLRFADVLRHYGVATADGKRQHAGPCPLPGHGERRNPRSFSANLDRGIFQCFGCGAKGNLLEFAALMERLDPKDGDALRKAALVLQERFFPEGASRRHPAPGSPKEEPAQTAPAEAVLVNPPLNFELKGLDGAHAYLKGRGFSQETTSRFGVGFCSRGSLKGRIAIPIHDAEGRLVGYAGRVVDDREITRDNPRYLFPPPREREGRQIEFGKSLLLYNAHRLEAPCDDLIVVEGFPSVWWLHQCGFSSAVAVMGSSCSDEQVGAIVSLVRPGGRVWAMPDEDEPGRRLAEALLLGVSPHRFVRWIRIGKKDAQPTDLSSEELKARFSL